MKTICKNIAFSDCGECLLGEKCICKANELWLEETHIEPAKERDEDHNRNVGEIPKEIIEWIESKYGNEDPKDCHYFKLGAMTMYLRLMNLEGADAAQWKERYRILSLGVKGENARKNIPNGMDDWCEAHQEYYKDECPKCVAVPCIGPVEEEVPSQDVLWDEVQSIANEDLYQELVSRKTLEKLKNRYTITRK